MTHSPITLIFSHYGASEYLMHTLACARRSNPSARLVLLGDSRNAEFAAEAGWEHYDARSFTSLLRDRFNAVYRRIEGERHARFSDTDGGFWLRYVAERWFMVQAFVSQEGIDRFWHFDSDTMILKDLKSFQAALSEIHYTTQCNRGCLNGYMTTAIVTEYCQKVCDLYVQQDYVANLERIMLENPDMALTEMTTFAEYMRLDPHRHLWLMEYSEDLIFDDAICQAHGFDSWPLRNGRPLKALFAESGRIFAMRGDRKIEFASLNLSWLPVDVFRWVERASLGADGSLGEIFELVDSLV